MAVKTEGPRDAGYIVSEANGFRSRDEIKLLASIGTVLPGAVLGKITASGKYKPHDPALSDGAQVAAAINFAKVIVGAADVRATASVRDCEVAASGLIYNAATDTQGEKDAVHAALAALGIIVRT